MTLTIGSLCAGYGGLDMGLQQVLDAKTAWFCEFAAGPSKILAHRYPGIPNLSDLTAIDWELLVRGKAPDLTTTTRMYDLYLSGLSLADIAEREGVTRQTVYTRFKRQGLAMRSVTSQPHVDYLGTRYSSRDNGYLRATTGDREYLHRVVWMHHHGAIPDGWQIHHRDHDKTNNTIANLECLTADEHARLYNIGCNAFQHKCAGGDAPASFAVDVVTAGWPQSVPAVVPRRFTKGSR